MWVSWTSSSYSPGLGAAAASSSRSNSSRLRSRCRALGGVDQRLTPSPEIVVGLAGRRVRRGQRFQPAEGVEQRALAVGIDERAVLVLAVDVDQPIAQLLERGDRHGHAVHLSGAPPLSRDPSGDDDRPVLEGGAENLLELAAERGLLDLEDGRGARLGLAGADEIGRGLAAEHQAESRQQQALARPGLPGPDAEAPLQLDLDVLDRRQVLHRQFT